MKPITIGNLALGAQPAIAVPLFDDDPEGDVAAVRDLADLVELRIDCFARTDVAHVREVVRRTRAAGSPPLLATVRWREEGGQADLSDAERIGLYEAVAELVDAVDIELAAPIRDRILALARDRGLTAVASHHSFTRMPAFDELEALVDRADEGAVPILKVAAAPESMADVRRLLEFTLRHRDRGLVTIALGELGAISRVFFPLAGSLFTFAHHRAASGPGQLPLAELRAQIRRYYPAG